MRRLLAPADGQLTKSVSGGAKGAAAGHGQQDNHSGAQKEKT
jgi:hypothetical protein